MLLQEVDHFPAEEWLHILLTDHNLCPSQPMIGPTVLHLILQSVTMSSMWLLFYTD